MKKKFSLFSMAALFFVGAIVTGCSNEDESEPSTPQPTPSKSITLSTTVSRDGEGNTRAVTEGGVKTFAVGEQIAVIYTNTSSQRMVAVSNALTVGDITNDGKNAKITVTLTDPVAGSVDYIYPANMANSDGTTNYSALCMQDGTWATISSKLDYAKGSGEMTGSGNKFTLPTITLANQLAICKFKVKNSGSEITSSITGLTVSDGINTYTVSRPATDTPIYMAIQPVSSDKTLSFVANNASNSYYKNVTNLTLAANNIYPLTVTMTQGQTKDLATLGADYEAQNGDMLIGKLGESHKISIAAGATVTLNGASINYDDTPALSGSFAGITCLGNATIIVSGTDYVKGFNEGYPGIFVPSGSTLTITGDGTLFAAGHENGAGIGSGRSDVTAVKDAGNIVIQGGRISSVGGYGAAGIGSGAGAQDNPSSCGNITIKSSVTDVDAMAGTGAKSIGHGDHSTCGTIIIEE
jgi:hypothetical protein